MMTISYRMLATIVGVVLLFGVGAAFVVDDEDDGDDSAAVTTTVTTAPDDDEDDDEDDEEKDDSTSTTLSSPTTATTAAGATTTTTAAAGDTTTTTRRPGSSTTTTRPPATTAPPTTAAPPPPPPPTTAAPAPESADLLVHATVGGDDQIRRTVITVENAGPGDDVDLRLTVSGAGAPVRSVQGGSGFDCSDNGSTVTCNASGVGIGGRVRQVVVEWAVSPGCAGTPVLTASVSSSTPDPNTANNAIVPRSLCPAAG